LFNSLAALTDLDGARIADLYAGSGAVGLEALSRGAAHALLVEADPAVAAVLRRNVATLGLPGAEVRIDRVERAVASRPREPYDVVFLDPPYARTDADLQLVLTALVARGWTAPDTVVVLERATREGPPSWVEGLTEVRSRRYGEGTLWYGRAS
jgi:16S rRNA (guanine966-N2)-methyltransferase